MGTWTVLLPLSIDVVVADRLLSALEAAVGMLLGAFIKLELTVRPMVSLVEAVFFAVAGLPFIGLLAAGSFAAFFL